MRRALLVFGSLAFAAGCHNAAAPNLLSPKSWGGSAKYTQVVTGISSATVSWTGTVFWDTFNNTEVYYVRPGTMNVVYSGKVAAQDSCTSSATDTPKILSTPGGGGVGAGSTNLVTVQKDGSYTGSLTVDATLDVTNACPVSGTTHESTPVSMVLTFGGQMDSSAPRMTGTMTPITFGTTTYSGSWDFEAGRTAMGDVRRNRTLGLFGLEAVNTLLLPPLR